MAKELPEMGNSKLTMYWLQEVLKQQRNTRESTQILGMTSGHLVSQCNKGQSELRMFVPCLWLYFGPGLGEHFEKREST